MRPLLALLVLLSVVALPGVAAGVVTTVSVEDVTITPAQPNPGERFTIMTTLRNAESASAPVLVTDLAVRTQGSETLTRKEDLGSIPPGGTLRVPVTLSLEETGTRTLELFVTGRGPGGDLSITYPVVIPVRPGGPQLAVSASDAVVGTRTAVTVQAVNGEETPVRNVRLTLTSDNATVANDSRVVPSLGAGAARSFTFDVTPEATETDLTATLRYTTQTGDARTLRDVTSLGADPLREEVRLDATVGTTAQPPVLVDVSNLGNAPLDDVVVAAADGDRTVARRPVADVEPGATRRVTLNVTGVDEADLDVRAEYETGRTEGSASTTVAYAANPGRIELTGIDLEREDGRVHLSGSAGNVGLSSAQSVVVRVLPADGVTPARPNREYFVGTVPASDFVSFDLYAEVDDGVGTVPVQVTYLSQGERRERVVDVDVSDLSAAEQPQQGPDLPLTAIVGAGVVALVLLLALLGYAVYRR